MAGEKTGTLAILGAKIFFLVSGYSLVITLARLLTKEEFGLYQVLFSIVNPLNMVLIYGSMQAVSHFVAVNAGRERDVLRLARLTQAGFATCIVGTYLLLTPAIADALNDRSVLPLLRGGALIMFVYAFYAINVGYLNGRRWFVRQASLDLTFATLKVGSILILVALGYGVAGIVGGFSMAAVTILIVSFFVLGKRTRPSSVSLHPRDFVQFALSAMAVALFLNLVLNADLFLLKRLSPPKVSNLMAGDYGSAQQIARIPYYLMATGALILFPMIARLHRKDTESLHRRSELSSRAFAAVLSLMAAIAACVVPLSEQVVLVLFPQQYASAGPMLELLIIALCALTMVNLSVAMISGAGRPRVSALIVSSMLAVQIGAAYVLIPTQGGRGAAAATLVASLFGLVCVVGWMRAHLGLRVPLRMLVLTAVVVAVGYGTSSALGGLYDDRIWTVLVLAVSFSLCVVVALLGGGLTGAGAGLKTKRILLVSKPLSPPWNDGAKTYVLNMVHHLPPGRFVVPTAKGSARLDGLADTVEQVPIYGSGGSFAGRSLHNLRMFLFLLLNRYHYRALHFFFAPNRTTCRVIRCLKWISPGVTFIQTILSRPETFDGVERLLFGHIIIATSEATAEEIRSRAPSKEVLVIRPVVEVAPEQTPALEPATRFTLLFAGDVEHGGALPNLGHLLPPLMKTCPTVDLLFSVRAKTADTKRRAEAFCAPFIAEYGERFTAVYDAPDFPGLLRFQDAMIFVCDSLYKKVDAPYVVLESLALGKPVFMLDVAPLNEIVSETDRDALLGRDLDDLLQRIRAYVNDRSVIDADSLRQHVNSRFGGEACRKGLTKLYDRIN